MDIRAQDTHTLREVGVFCCDRRMKIAQNSPKAAPAISRVECIGNEIPIHEGNRLFNINVPKNGTIKTSAINMIKFHRCPILFGRNIISALSALFILSTFPQQN